MYWKAYYNRNDEIVRAGNGPYKVPTHIIAAEVQVERLLSLYGARVVVIRTDYTVFSVTGQGGDRQNDQNPGALWPDRICTKCQSGDHQRQRGDFIGN